MDYSAQRRDSLGGSDPGSGFQFPPRILIDAYLLSRSIMPSPERGPVMGVTAAEGWLFVQRRYGVRITESFRQ